jgi:hypothetical protein
MRLPVFACSAVLLLGLCCVAALGQKKEDLAPLIKKLKSAFASDVKEAAQALEKKGPAAKEAIPHLAEALKKANFDSERIAIARALEAMGPAAKSAVPALTETLKDKAKFKDERVTLARVLGKLGPAARSAVPVLAAALKTGFSEERIAAARALAQIGPAAGAAKKDLAEAAKTGFSDVQKAAGAALAQIQSLENRIGIKDNGKCFSAKAVDKALDKVYELAHRHKVDLLIDTVAEIPADKKANVRVMTAKERGRFFVDWSKSRAKAAKVDGIYVLICKQPGFIQVLLTLENKTRFDTGSAGRVTEVMRKDFMAQKFDQGLEDGIAVIENRLAKKARK